MTEYITDRIRNIQESATLKMSRLSRELKEQGQDIVNLSLGEPDFDTPDHIKLAAIKAIEENYTHYPPVAGYPELRQAIVDKFKNENGLTYKTSQVMVSTGAKQSLMNIIFCMLQEGDEIIVPSPYWVSYPEMIKLSGATVKFIPTNIDSGFKISAAQLEAAITPKTRAFIYSSPSNPTGSFYSRSELEALAKVFAKYPQIIIISDEIYEHINYTGGHASLAQFPEIYEQVVVVNGVAKAFAMTGWRIGYMAGPEWLAKACEKLQGQFTSGACSISQRATLAALTSSMAPTEAMCKAFAERRELVVKLFGEMEGFRFHAPEGAFYLFPDISYYFGKSFNGEVIKNDEDFCMFILKEARVTVVAGGGFGDKNCIRISFAASTAQLEEAVRRIKEALKLLQ